MAPAPDSPFHICCRWSVRWRESRLARIDRLRWGSWRRDRGDALEYAHGAGHAGSKRSPNFTRYLVELEDVG